LSSTSFSSSASTLQSPSLGEPVKFNATANVYSSTTTPPVFDWSFGDGTNATGARVVDVYQKPGPYRIVLTGIIPQGSPSISKTVIVRPGIVVISQTFDNINVTVFATFNVNSRATQSLEQSQRQRSTIHRE